jgi:hypothetical protein
VNEERLREILQAHIPVDWNGDYGNPHCRCGLPVDWRIADFEWAIHVAQEIMEG